MFNIYICNKIYLIFISHNNKVFCFISVLLFNTQFSYSERETNDYLSKYRLCHQNSQCEFSPYHPRRFVLKFLKIRSSLQERYAILAQQ